MKKIVKQWLGIDKLEEKLNDLIADMTGTVPDKPEINPPVVKKKNDLKKMINDYGPEGDL